MRTLQRLSIIGLCAFAFFYLAACGGGGGGGAAPVTVAGTETFSATITLAQEVPDPTIPVGATPSGSGSVTLNTATKMITGSFTTTNVTGATLAHIHDGDIGVTGGIVVGLEQSAPGVWSVPANTVLTDLQIARLRASGYYVNIHTTLNPSGEIRGQLLPPGSASTAFGAAITLAQEVPDPTIPVGATPSGSGSVTLNTATKMITGSFTTTNVTGATLAHIHDGDIGVTGGIVVGLDQSAPGVWSVPANTVLTDLQIARLRGAGYYVNIHTTLNPSGEIRGQLIPSN